MHQESRLRRPRESSQPRQKLLRVGVIAELFKRSYMGANRNFLGINPHRLSAVLDDGPARARRLKANEDHLIARIGQAEKQVVQDASSGHHAASTNNDAG